MECLAVHKGGIIMAWRGITLHPWREICVAFYSAKYLTVFSGSLSQKSPPPRPLPLPCRISEREMSSKLNRLKGPKPCPSIQ